jgi:hypothetical protein
MASLLKHKLIAELLWWILTAIVVVMILYPVWINTKDFPFYAQNAMLIIVFITFSRYFFFLPISFIARLKWIKVAIVLSVVLFCFILATALGDFRNYMDEEGLQTLVTHLHVTKQTSVMTYIKNEMIFFGTGSIITAILLTFRLIISLWRMRNSGRV